MRCRDGKEEEDDNDDDDGKNSSNSRHIVIVGAGISGLVASKELLSLFSQQQEQMPSNKPRIRITLVEASHRIGGRLYRHNNKSVKKKKKKKKKRDGGSTEDENDVSVNDDDDDDSSSCSSSSWAGDLGAELVHGKDTLLTQYFDELRKDGAWEEEKHGEDCCEVEGNDNNNDNFYTEFFITAHADGGPDERPTTDSGKYGMYFTNGQLLKYDHPDIAKLSRALEQVLEFKETNNDDDDMTMMSVGVALKTVPEPPLPDNLYSLAVASYGNTAGSTDLNQLSLPIIQKFEKYWEENETAGDYQPPPSIGIFGLAYQILQKYLMTNPNFQLKLNWKVKRITTTQQQENGLLRVVSDDDDDDDECIIDDADAVIVTVPPPLLSQMDIIGISQSLKKVEALQYVGYERVVKVCLKFNRRIWPEHIQGIVCADDDNDSGCLVPEMWFSGELKCRRCRSSINAESSGSSSSSSSYYKAVAFLTSGAANTFMERIRGEDTTNLREEEKMASELILSQLSKVFQVPLQDFQDAIQGIVICDWGKESKPYIGGGYLYPRVGMKSDHLHALAAPVDGHNIFFAGEATNTNACCTVQAAMETGVRAAKEVAAAVLEQGKFSSTIY